MSEVPDLREIFCECGEQVILSHHDEGFGHQFRCCDCFDLAMGMPKYLLDREKLYRQLPCLEGTGKFRRRRKCACINCAYVLAVYPAPEKS